MLEKKFKILCQNFSTNRSLIQTFWQEYKVYDNTEYFLGRKKVLEHFLAKKTIYENSYFYELYEESARYNLRKELKLL